MPTNKNLCQASYKQRRYLAGLCNRCGSPLDSPARHCARCRQDDSERSKQWRDRMAAEGKCVDCQSPRDRATSPFCAACREKRNRGGRKQYQERKAAGLCVECGASPICAPSKVFCSSCFERIITETYQSRDRRRYGNHHRSTLERDGYQCFVCGRIKSLAVHHRDGNPENNEPVNLITLCKRCHWAVTLLSSVPQPALLYELAKELKSV